MLRTVGRLVTTLLVMGSVGAACGSSSSSSGSPDARLCEAVHRAQDGRVNNDTSKVVVAVDDIRRLASKATDKELRQDAQAMPKVNSVVDAINAPAGYLIQNLDSRCIAKHL